MISSMKTGHVTPTNRRPRRCYNYSLRQILILKWSSSFAQKNSLKTSGTGHMRSFSRSRKTSRTSCTTLGMRGLLSGTVLIRVSSRCQVTSKRLFRKQWNFISTLMSSTARMTITPTSDVIWMRQMKLSYQILRLWCWRTIRDSNTIIMVRIQ